MKNIIIPLIAAMAMLGMAGCEKDKTKDPIEEINSSAANMHRFLISTEWRYVSKVTNYDANWNIVEEILTTSLCTQYDRLKFDNDTMLTISNPLMQCGGLLSAGFLNQCAAGYGSTSYHIEYDSYFNRINLVSDLPYCGGGISQNILRNARLLIKNDSTMLFIYSNSLTGVRNGHRFTKSN